MKQLSKTQRQRREYNKYSGFLSIKKNYDNLLEKSMNDVDRLENMNRVESVNKDLMINRLESFHRQFLTNNRNVKKRCGIRLVDENIYERRWIDDYNKLKIKLKKMC